jgi:hypothetical protein
MAFVETIRSSFCAHLRLLLLGNSHTVRFAAPESAGDSHPVST